MENSTDRYKIAFVHSDLQGHANCNRPGKEPAARRYVSALNLSFLPSFRTGLGARVVKTPASAPVAFPRFSEVRSYGPDPTNRLYESWRQQKKCVTRTIQECLHSCVLLKTTKQRGPKKNSVA
jgi:hypothetical protein